ncbi:hypothetical protein TREES_T100021418 [Tupaia chinensis]|uniref:Uncharacterized protein n=1 Tax=Tupaia chinensis TaxID=246437 RepID=L9L651_TUPCH|nr:hypothetical protein TREES_T100021418 [Tupaia chinensis]
MCGEHVVMREEHVAMRGEHVAMCGEHVATRGEHVAMRGEHMATLGEHMATRGEHVATRGEHVATRGEHVAMCGARRRMRGTSQAIPRKDDKLVDKRLQDSGVISKTTALAAVPTQTLANCPVPSGTREHLDRDQSWGRTQQLENLSLPPAEGKALALRADSPHPGLTGGQLAADWSWVPRGDPVSCWAMTSRGGPKDSCDGVAV